MSIRVLLADDSAIVRQGIRDLLRSQPEIELVGEAADFRETIHMIKELNPQVVVLNLHMGDGTEAMIQHVKCLLKHGSRLLAISFLSDEDTKALIESLGTVPLLDKMELHQKLIPTIMQLVSA